MLTGRVDHSCDGQEWERRVSRVAIDTCVIFKAAVRAGSPHALLVVDHFHVVQLTDAAPTEVRRRVSVQV
ncbi:transposase [Nonomuraea zeae]|uniref:Transposase n=1 Tax=Nonomuraea zeae TaxID=1642303 RepID=A0A5S4GR71_9ACTN|nr:transposase [Nonomuraea zeae]